MFDYLLPYLFEAMSFLGGQSVQPGWEEKARLALSAAAFLVLFSCLFAWFYHKQFWQKEGNHRLLWRTVFLLAGAALLKFTIFYLAKGYLPDRTLFYALPSPKFSGVWNGSGSLSSRSLSCPSSGCSREPA